MAANTIPECSIRPEYPSAVSYSSHSLAPGVPVAEGQSNQSAGHIPAAHGNRDRSGLATRYGVNRGVRRCT